MSGATLTALGDGTAPPAQFLHICTVYERMKQKSHEQDNGDGHTITVYEGHLTKLVTQDLQLAIPYYTSVRRAMLGMGLATQLKRGGGSSASIWQLHKPPTLEDYGKYENREGLGKYSSTSKAAIRDGQIRDLSARVAALEETIADILEAISSGSAA